MTFSTASTITVASTLAGSPALDAAAAPGFDAIAFTSTLNGGTIALDAPSASKLTVADTGGVSIDASSLTGGLTLTIVPDGNSRLMLVQGDARLSLHHLRLTGGNRSTGSGGAILNDSSTLLLDRCSLYGNSTEIPPSAVAPLKTSRTTSAPPAPRCGIARFREIRRRVLPAAAGSAIPPAGSTLVHCTVSGNNAQAASAGGVSSEGNSSVRTEVEKTVIAGNTGGDVQFVNGSTNPFVSLGHNLRGGGRE